jgi:hypothetical protein
MCCYCCCCCCWSDGIFPIVMEMMVEWIQFSLVTVPPPFLPQPLDTPAIKSLEMNKTLPSSAGYYTGNTRQ